MKLKIVRLDKNGYNGREYYALDSDVGTNVLVVGLWVTVYDHDGNYLGEAMHHSHGVPVRDARIPYAVPNATAAFYSGHLEYMWTCLTPDYRTIQLMGHEVEVVL